jgi:hypothetical protein
VSAQWNWREGTNSDRFFRGACASQARDRTAGADAGRAGAASRAAHLRRLYDGPPRRRRDPCYTRFVRSTRCEHAEGSRQQDMSNSASQFLGGSPVSVVVRLVLLSILVGVILSVLGFDPWNIFASIERLIRSLWHMGFDAVVWLWRYFLLGAVVVIPIWLIVRLSKGGRG